MPATSTAMLANLRNNAISDASWSAKAIVKLKPWFKSITILEIVRVSSFELARIGEWLLAESMLRLLPRLTSLLVVCGLVRAMHESEMTTRYVDRRQFVCLGATAAASMVFGLAACSSAPDGVKSASSAASSAAGNGSSVPSPPSSELGLASGSASSHEIDSSATQVGSVSQGAATHAVEDKRLVSGFTMPALGLGTWTLSVDQAEASSYCALENGYRLIDTAQYYGNEEGVGNAVRRAVSDGLCAREDVFVTSKIMPSSFDRAASSIDESLARLDIGYVDLMLIHQPGNQDEVVWRALEDAVRAGKVRSIGISNYYTPASYDAVANIAEIPVALVQNENHPFYQNDDLQAYVERAGSFVESWYPLGGRPGVAQLLANETLQAIAAAHGKTVAQTILRWHVQAGYIAIPGSSNPDHIAENIQIFDFALSEGEMAQISALNGVGRFENW